MAVVVDANVLVILISGDPRRDAAQALIRQWITSGEAMHAPALLPYEVANGLTRLVTAGVLSLEQLGEGWRVISSLPITYHPLETEGDKVVEVAVGLRRQSAYDAAYVVLAQRLGAKVWTFDGPLAQNAVGRGFPVRLIEEQSDQS